MAIAHLRPAKPGGFAFAYRVKLVEFTVWLRRNIYDLLIPFLKISLTKPFKSPVAAYKSFVACTVINRPSIVLAFFSNNIMTPLQFSLQQPLYFYCLGC